MQFNKAALIISHIMNNILGQLFDYQYSEGSISPGKVKDDSDKIYMPNVGRISISTVLNLGLQSTLCSPEVSINDFYLNTNYWMDLNQN